MTTTMEIETKDSFVLVVRLGGSLSDELVMEYATAFANEAVLCGDDLQVPRPSAQLLEVVREVWNTVAPRSRGVSRESLAGLVANVKIVHHLKLIGAEVWSPARLYARSILEKRPDLAQTMIRGFFANGEFAHKTLAEFLASSGSMTAEPRKLGEKPSGATTLKMHAFCEHSGELVAGEPVETFILAHAGLPTNEIVQRLPSSAV